MNLTDIKNAAIKEVELSGWDGEPFVCKLRRPALYNMASVGYIPNPLMATVQTMFSNDVQRLAKINVTEQAKALQLMARYALLEPTMAELDEAGIELTDDQLLEIYSFTLRGAQGLETFRTTIRRAVGANEQAVPQPTEPTPAP